MRDWDWVACLTSTHFRKVIEGEEEAAPPGEVLEKGLLEIRVSSGLHQISRELSHAFGPDFIGSLSLAS